MVSSKETMIKDEMMDGLLYDFSIYLIIVILVLN